jgi:hypothetical protein
MPGGGNTQYFESQMPNLRYTFEAFVPIFKCQTSQQNNICILKIVPFQKGFPLNLKQVKTLNKITK